MTQRFLTIIKDNNFETVGTVETVETVISAKILYIYKIFHKSFPK